MDIQLKTLKNSNFMKEAADLYEDAFPKDERRPTQEWIEMIKVQKHFKAYYVEREGAFIGFVTLWEIGDFIYIEHLAIDRKWRGLSFGGQVMEILNGKTQKEIILEVEPPTDRTSVKRIRFYEKHGYTILCKDYMQPAYTAGRNSMPLYLMHREGIQKNTGIEDIVRFIYKNVYHII